MTASSATYVDLRAARFAVRRHPVCFARVVYGRAEAWVKITRLQALELLNGVDEFTTPEQAGFKSGTFARETEGALYLG